MVRIWVRRNLIKMGKERKTSEPVISRLCESESYFLEKRSVKVVE